MIESYHALLPFYGVIVVFGCYPAQMAANAGEYISSNRDLKLMIPLVSSCDAR